MTQPRSRQLCLELTPYYHCISRCVRRAFLCGQDKLNERNYNHRRQWIEEHLLFLSTYFCVDLVGYSVMSNHYHVLWRVNSVLAEKLSDKQVVEHWLSLYKGPPVAQQFLAGEVLSELEQKALEQKIIQWRSELCSISRVMGYLNEKIARNANAEDWSVSLLRYAG